MQLLGPKLGPAASPPTPYKTNAILGHFHDFLASFSWKFMKFQKKLKFREKQENHKNMENTIIFMKIPRISLFGPCRVSPFPAPLENWQMGL